MDLRNCTAEVTKVKEEDCEWDDKDDVCTQRGTKECNYFLRSDLSTPLFGPFEEEIDIAVNPDVCCAQGKKDACEKVTEETEREEVTWDKATKTCTKQVDRKCSWYLRSDM